MVDLCGWSATKEIWEPVTITETEVIEMLKDKSNKGKTIYEYFGDGEWEEFTLADFMSETLGDLAYENEKVFDRGQRDICQVIL